MKWLGVALVLPVLVEGREMRTDRPDTTESAYSVERGHWQVETELASGELDGGTVGGVGGDGDELEVWGG